MVKYLYEFVLCCHPLRTTLCVHKDRFHTPVLSRAGGWFREIVFSLLHPRLYEQLCDVMFYVRVVLCIRIDFDSNMKWIMKLFFLRFI